MGWIRIAPTVFVATFFRKWELTNGKATNVAEQQPRNFKKLFRERRVFIVSVAKLILNGGWDVNNYFQNIFPP